MARTVQYAGNTMTINDDTLTLQQIKESMAEIFPELANSTPRQNGDIITFDVQAGTKGARTVQYAGNTMTINDDTLTLQQIKESMAEIFPELANSTPRQNGDIITFDVQAGTKGFKLVAFESMVKLMAKFNA